MSVAKMDANRLAAATSAYIESELRHEINAELMKVAKEIALRVATEMASNVVAKIATELDYSSDRLMVSIQINGLNLGERT